MTGDEMLAWQYRHFGVRRGDQIKAARFCGVPVASWRHMLGGRMKVPGPLQVLMRYMDRFGAVDDLGGVAQDEEAGA